MSQGWGRWGTLRALALGASVLSLPHHRATRQLFEESGGNRWWAAGFRVRQCSHGEAQTGQKCSGSHSCDARGRCHGLVFLLRETSTFTVGISEVPWFEVSGL